MSGVAALSSSPLLVGLVRCYVVFYDIPRSCVCGSGLDVHPLVNSCAFFLYIVYSVLYCFRSTRSGALCKMTTPQLFYCVSFVCVLHVVLTPQVPYLLLVDPLSFSLYPLKSHLLTVVVFAISSSYVCRIASQVERVTPHFSYSTFPLTRQRDEHRKVGRRKQV